MCMILADQLSSDTCRTLKALPISLRLGADGGQEDGRDGNKQDLTWTDPVALDLATTTYRAGDGSLVSP